MGIPDQRSTKTHPQGRQPRTYAAHDGRTQITAHQLNEDRAADSFVQMCHALSNKINAKISRLRLDVTLEKIAEERSRIES